MKSLIFALLLIIAGCASPVIPEWRYLSYNQLESYKKYFLLEKDDIAEVHYKKAVEEIKKSGDLDVMARAYLTRAALSVAVLGPLPEDYLKLEAIEPMPLNANYFKFLGGAFTEVDAKLLPSQYQDFLAAILKRSGEDIENALLQMEDPLSRLVAIGLTVRFGNYNDKILNLAVETSSNQGWKRPLLVYLANLKSFYEASGDRDRALKVERRINLIK